MRAHVSRVGAAACVRSKRGRRVCHGAALLRLCLCSCCAVWCDLCLLFLLCVSIYCGGEEGDGGSRGDRGSRSIRAFNMLCLGLYTLLGLVISGQHV